jgi:hypothetical protein
LSWRGTPAFSPGSRPWSTALEHQEDVAVGVLGAREDLDLVEGLGRELAAGPIGMGEERLRAGLETVVVAAMPPKSRSIGS